MIKEVRHPIEILSDLYPQLRLPVKLGMSKNNIYIDTIKKGKIPSEIYDGFTLSSFDKLLSLDSVFGNITAIYLYNRDDFERFIQVMRYKCEPIDIPPSIGAMLITGIVSWNKINFHKRLYEKNGGDNWKDEFSNFTSKKENYTDTLIIVSRGSYSNIDYSLTGYDYVTWEEISFNIRIYHELTHFISRNLIHICNPILDEVIADCVGMLFSIGYYDEKLAKNFLGIEDEIYRTGARLEWYINENESLNCVMSKANSYIKILSDYFKYESSEFYDVNKIVEIIDKIYSLHIKKME